ncbi:hypothetical protein [Coraliomargarita parva]|uniref:hypothetical protein n=1 Tax=Coraliomargarita parva TaxID=3014050 RepID=UPI0022B2CCDA|nr:hypothetical protein [Coraliomargarita parva]
MENKKLSLEEIAAEILFVQHLGVVCVEYANQELLVESWKHVNGHTLRKDPPHFNGDVYHVHAKLAGGYEASWEVTGARRHPEKFPANVPRGVRQAAAQVLGIDVNLLECFWIRENNEQVLLIEVTDSGDDLL